MWYVEFDDGGTWWQFSFAGKSAKANAYHFSWQIKDCLRESGDGFLCKFVTVFYVEESHAEESRLEESHVLAEKRQVSRSNVKKYATKGESIAITARGEKVYPVANNTLLENSWEFRKIQIVGVTENDLIIYKEDL